MRTLLYPKRYGTVVARRGVRLTIQTDDGRKVESDISCRNGYGPTDHILPGTRVKLYRRPHRFYFEFRLIGS